MAIHTAFQTFKDGRGLVFVIMRFSGLVLCSVLCLPLPQQGEFIISSVFSCCSTVSSLLNWITAFWQKWNSSTEAACISARNRASKLASEPVVSDLISTETYREDSLILKNNKSRPTASVYIPVKGDYHGNCKCTDSSSISHWAPHTLPVTRSLVQWEISESFCR